MANCVLCRQRTGWLDQVKLDFHGTGQVFCADCANRFSQAAGEEREELCRQIWESPDLADVEKLRANVDTGKHCSACGAVLERKLTDFSIGADGYGGLTSLGMPQYNVDLYACPKCGKVELYTAAASLSQATGQSLSQRVRAEETVQAEQQEQVQRLQEQAGLFGRKNRKPPWEK